MNHFHHIFLTIHCFDIKIHSIREDMVKKMEEKFEKSHGFKFSIGGQISIDVFPVGWDKTYCLQHITEYDEVYFFGDKTMEGGNDFEIFSSPRVKGFTVKSPEDTVKQITELFLKN